MLTRQHLNRRLPIIALAGVVLQSRTRQLERRFESASACGPSGACKRIRLVQAK